jgi:YesN/AraC family two-component response regulator
MSSDAPVEEVKKRIFVVEDDAAIIKVHLHFLSGLFTVIIQPSGINAISYLRENPDIDLALVDLKLPDISGFEVLKEIKRIKPCIPTIIITAFGSEDVAVKAFRCGARDYIKKPFRCDELLRRINFCLSLNVIEQAERRTALTSEADEPAEDGMTGALTNRKTYNMQQALQYIHNNFSTEINLERVADTVGISKFHFCRLFKEMTGLTFRSYLNRFRIKQAKKILNDDALSITDAGYAVGYSDLTHFERIFKKVAGTTPSLYRNQTLDLSAAALEKL